MTEEARAIKIERQIERFSSLICDRIRDEAAQGEYKVVVGGADIFEEAVEALVEQLRAAKFRVKLETNDSGSSLYGYTYGPRISIRWDKKKSFFRALFGR